MDTLPRDLLALIAAALREQCVAHQPGWFRAKEDRRIFTICDGGFTFALAGMTCKLWHELIREAWLADPSLATSMALRRVRSEMAIRGGACDDSDDDDPSEGEEGEEDEDKHSWRRAECGLIVGVLTNYTDLREALCTGRRFWSRYELLDGRTCVPHGESEDEGHRSNLLADPPPLPTEEGDDGRIYVPSETPTEVPDVDAIRDGIPLPGLGLKWAMPERVAEISRNLKARGGLFELQCFCVGGESNAGEEVVLGYKIGDMHWRQVRGWLGDLDELLGEEAGPYAHERFFRVDEVDLEELIDPYDGVAPPLACFYDAIHPLARDFLRGFWVEANPQHGTLHTDLLEPSFFIGGQAGSQGAKKYQLKEAREARAPDDVNAD